MTTLDKVADESTPTETETETETEGPTESVDEQNAGPGDGSDGEQLAGSPDASINAELVGAYSFLQLVIGMLAVALPIVVVVVDWLFADSDWFTTRGSISAYYYARGGGWLVGTLCVTAFFFLSYKYKWDPRNITDFATTKVAAIAALGVALFPTTSEGGSDNIVGVIHYVSALVLFGLLTFLVLFSFTKSAGQPDRSWRIEIRRLFKDPPDVGLLPGKRRRNLWYRIAGWSMAAVLILSLLYSLIATAFPDSALLVLPGSWFFFAESIVVILFGVVWLLKSKLVPALPKDHSPVSS